MKTKFLLTVLLAIVLVFVIAFPPTRKDMLHSAFLSQSSAEREEALQSLRAGGESSIPKIAEGLKNRDWRIRAGCASLLGEVKSEKAVDMLLAALNDREGSVKLTAIESLGRIGDKRALPNLLILLSSDNQNIRLAAIHALGTMGDEAALSDSCSRNGMPYIPL